MTDLWQQIQVSDTTDHCSADRQTYCHVHCLKLDVVAEELTLLNILSSFYDVYNNNNNNDDDDDDDGNNNNNAKS